MISFEKVNSNYYIVKLDSSYIDNIVRIANELSNGNNTIYETYSNDAFIESLIARKVSSDFIDKEFKNAGVGVILLDVKLGNKKLEISIGKLEVAEGEYKYVSGVLYN